MVEVFYYEFQKYPVISGFSNKWGVLFNQNDLFDVVRHCQEIRTLMSFQINLSASSDLIALTKLFVWKSPI